MVRSDAILFVSPPWAYKESEQLLIDCDWLSRNDADPGADDACVIGDAGDGDAGPDEGSEGSIGARPPDVTGPSPSPPGHDVRALAVTQQLVYHGVKRCGPNPFLACSGRPRRLGATAMMCGPRRGWTATMTSMWGRGVLGH
jgi:hypothetical protein